MSDISAQPYSLPELTELRAVLSDMPLSLPGILYRCRNDSSWTMLDLAEPVRELTGYGPEAFIGNAEIAYADLIHEEDRARVWDEVQAALAADLSFRTAYRIRTRAGAIRQVWEQGRRTGAGDEILGFIQDVTDWREKWGRLEESAHLMERTLSSLGEAVFVIDTSGAGRGIIRVNRAAERIFGYTQDELLGGTTENLHVDRASFLEFAEELEPLLEAEGVVHASYPMRRKDGTEFAAEQTVSLLDPEAGVRGGAVSVVRDVSERQALHRQLQQSQRMEAVGRLAGGVAHDFNNLLTVIRAHTDFMLMEVGDDGPLADEVRAVQEAAGAAADLTSQLLTFGREQVLRPRVIDMNAVLRRVDRLLERVIEETITVRMELHPEPLPVEVDPGQLEQALVNLAVNARDAMPGGGTLTLATALETPDGTTAADEPDTGSVRVTVRDTGEGMDAATQARIFEPFYTTKRQGRGTGLGLATTYGFVSQSGGTLEVDSAPDEGSAFTLRFPVSTEEVEARSEPRPTSTASLAGRTVLVVEDETNVRRVVEKALARAGATVRTAETGEAGLDVLAAEREALDLVITDLVLPGVSGHAVAERALSREPTVPVIVMSGYAADTSGQVADIPVDADFLAKPFTPAELVERARVTLAG
jgi:PAS domain S-box-containing protein